MKTGHSAAVNHRNSPMTLSNPQPESTLCRTIVPQTECLSMLPKHLGPYMLVFESGLYDQMAQLSDDCKAARWAMYELSNGGFYMAPVQKNPLLVEAPNQFSGMMSPDAAGIAACMYMYSSLAYSAHHAGHTGMSQKLSDLYHCLREWICQHDEEGLIFAAIN